MAESEETAEGLQQFIAIRSATGLVIANMIGAGIFTSTGFQAEDLGHPLWIYTLWVIGGALAFIGALCFAELGAMLPKAGAEYVYIRESYGQAFAFMSAFVALIAGFSAPIAAAAKSFIVYLAHFIEPLQNDPHILGISSIDLCAILSVWGIVVIHSSGAKFGIGVSDLITAFKVAGVVIIILAAFAVGDGNAAWIVESTEVYTAHNTSSLFGAMATALIFVNFCYLGWNASAYMAAEMKEPQKTLPASLLLGTAIVTGLYLLLNVVYFYAAGAEGLAGKVDVGVVAATNLFGPNGVTLVTLVLCVSILASASAMSVAGSRVYYAFGKDFTPLAWLAEISPMSNAPWKSLTLQGVVITVIILSGTVDQILQYAGFTLTLFASIAVSCVIALRIKQPDAPRPFRVWGYPLTPIAFITVSIWTMVWSFQGRPIESSLGLVTATLGGLIFWSLKRAKA